MTDPKTQRRVVRAALRREARRLNPDDPDQIGGDIDALTESVVAALNTEPVAEPGRAARARRRRYRPHHPIITTT